MGLLAVTNYFWFRNQNNSSFIFKKISTNQTIGHKKRAYLDKKEVGFSLAASLFLLIKCQSPVCPTGTYGQRALMANLRVGQRPEPYVVHPTP